MTDRRYQYNIFDENSEWWAEVEGIGLGPLRAAQGYLAQTPDGFIERRIVGEWEKVPAIGGTA